MRPFILIAAMLVLVGCQTVDDFIGTGPITLSSNVSNHYQNKYLKGVGPQYYVVSADGQHSRYVYCSAGPGQCTFGLVVLDSITKCEKRARQKCYIFAQGDEVVWNGPVSYGGRTISRSESNAVSSKVFDGEPPKSTNLTSMNNWRVCGWAIQPSTQPPLWRTAEEYLPYVQQAHIRGFSTQFCAEFLETGSVEGLSDATLCKYALGTDGEDPAWVFIGRFSHYYYEAERRGFSPKTCMEIVPKADRENKAAGNAAPKIILKRNGMMLTNKKLCAPALDIEQGEPRWAQYWGYKGYTNEAQYRGLTPLSCHQATKAGATPKNTIRNVEDYSDTELCNLSVTLPDGEPIWSTNEDDQEYVKAAKSKGLTPSNCISSPYVT